MAKKKKVKKFAWEKKPKIAKPKKTDFIKKEKKWAYKDKKPTNKNAKKKFIKPRTVFGWEDREHISKPKKSDFKEVKKRPLKWNIPWLNKLLYPEKVEEPNREDFIEKEERKVSQPIITAREVLVEEKIVERKIIKEKPTFEEEINTTKEGGVLTKIMLGVIIICYLLFIVLLSTLFLEVTFEDYLLIENLFFIVAGLSIILAAFYAFQKEIFKGFIYISLTILVYIILGAIFAEPLLKSLNVLLIILAVLPIELYLIFYVK